MVTAKILMNKIVSSTLSVGVISTSESSSGRALSNPCAFCGQKLISIPAVKSETTHALALGAAKKRDQKAATHNARVQREYELHHND